VRLRAITKFYSHRARLLEPDLGAAFDDDPAPRRLPVGERTRKLAKLLQRDSDWDRDVVRGARKQRNR
jgi:hypothetical protein